MKCMKQYTCIYIHTMHRELVAAKTGELTTVQTMYCFKVTSYWCYYTAKHYMYVNICMVFTMWTLISHLDSFAVINLCYINIMIKMSRNIKQLLSLKVTKC